MRKKKFPITVYVKITQDGDYLSYWNDVNIWANENIGKYNEYWKCPSTYGLDYNDSFPYTFKNEEDATLFKLRWG